MTYFKEGVRLLEITYVSILHEEYIKDIQEKTMSHIPTIAFAAYSGSGKTTLIEKLIMHFKQKGLRVAVIKHDGHKFEIDHEGKDSWRFTHAGADITMIGSSENFAYIETRPLTLDQQFAMVHDVDLILVEGYKNSNLPQIGIARAATQKGFTAAPDQFIAIATDMEINVDIPCFRLDDIDSIAKFILQYFSIT